MNEQSPISTAEPSRPRAVAAASPDVVRPQVGEDEDFAPPSASRRRMQVWLTTFTVLAAVAVLAVVSLAVLHAR